MFGIIALILLVIWIVGLSLHFLGGFIYLFLVVAIIAGIAHFMTSSGGDKQGPI
jgi:hypothetical protein